MRRKTVLLKIENGRLRVLAVPIVICEGKLPGQMSMTQTKDNIKSSSMLA